MKPITLAAIAALTACSSEGIEYETETYGEAEFARVVVRGYGYQGKPHVGLPDQDYCKHSDKCWRPEARALEYAVFDNPNHHPWFNRLLLDALNDAVRPARDRGWTINISSSSDNSEDGYLDRFDDVHGFVVSHEVLPHNTRYDVWMRDFPLFGDGNYYGHTGRLKFNDSRIWDEAGGDTQKYATGLRNYMRRVVGYTLGIGWSDGQFANNSPVMGGDVGSHGPENGWYDSVKPFSAEDLFYIENYVP